MVSECFAHHAAARGDQHQKEGAEQFGEEATPLLVRIVEVGEDSLERLDSVAGVHQVQWTRGALSDAVDACATNHAPWRSSSKGIFGHAIAPLGKKR